MTFSSCFILWSLIGAYGTAEGYKVHKNLGKNQHPAKAQQHNPEEFQPLSFCNGVECPKYRLVKKYPGFEHREYDAAHWVSTPVTINKESMDASYVNLYQYMNGSNSAGVHLRITSPLVIMIHLDKDRPEQFTMSMFLPAKLKHPPKPLMSTISLQSYPKASLYVKSFGGVALKEDYAKHIEALTKELIGLGLAFDKSLVACNIYDPPTKLTNRHNEVWFLAALQD